MKKTKDSTVQGLEFKQNQQVMTNSEINASSPDPNKPPPMDPFEPHPPEVRTLYAEWIALPTKDRDPQTKRGFAQRYGINERTLLGWEQDSDFAESIRLRVCATELTYAGEVAQQVRKRATGETDKGSARHAELHMRHLSGLWNARGDIEAGIAGKDRQNLYTDLSTGRLGEQLDGIIAHLERTEDREDTEYTEMPAGEEDTPVD